MIKYKIGLLFSKKDYLYNVDNYGKTYNLLFITGLVGAGKSTISKELSKEKEITILSQDWLTWSEVYSDDKIATDILNKFYKTCPKAQEAAINNLWHKNLLSKIEKNKIKTEYNNFLIDYTLKNPDKLYIIEGIDIYKVINLDEIIKRGIIIKGTSVIKCFARRYRRDKTINNQKNLISKINYLIMVIKQSKIFYFKDRTKLNKLINNIHTYQKKEH